jgi:hypothetical protein
MHVAGSYGLTCSKARLQVFVTVLCGVLYIRGRLLVSSRPVLCVMMGAERLARGGIRALRARQGIKERW